MPAGASLIIVAIIMQAAAFAASGNQHELTQVQMAAVTLENRFIAIGKVLQIERSAGGLQKIRLKVEKVEQVAGFVNSGAAYQGKEIDVLSETGIPPSWKTGSKISALLRVTGDEWRQTIFLIKGE